jgi:predicted nucleotidyltransferase
MDLDREILRAAANIPGISVLIVFGSRARGTNRPNSDLDVAVLPENVDSEARRRLQTRLAAALADLIPEGWVDVVILDETDNVLRQRVMETGRVLFCRDPEAWKELRIRTMRDYGDREWARRLFRQAQRRRLTSGETRGRSGKAVESLKRLGRLPR